MKQQVPFIVFDGMDGSGKGTQMRLLEERSQKEQRKIVFTREPGGVPLAEELRTVFKSPLGMQADALTQFLLMWAARNEWMKKFVIPQVTNGFVVCTDRSDSSTLAYQVYAKEAHELEDEFWRMRRLVFAKHEPSLYVILDVPAETARERSLADSTHTSDFDVAPLGWYESVRTGFQAFVKGLPDKVVVIDGTRIPLQIHEEIYSIIARHCGW